MSDLQADGTWGPATLISELSSPELEARASIRQDGLEIFFYSDRAGSAASDLWGATRATVGAPWSTPENLGTTVNSVVNDRHPYLSADGRTLFFSSSRPGGLGGDDLYMTTRAQILPTIKDDCRNGGWERFGVFKNQGDCVSYVATGGRNAPG